MRFLTTDEGFTYGGIHSADWGAFLTDLQIPPSPGTIDNELVIPGSDGTYDAGTDLSRLDMSMQIGIWVPTGSRQAINDAVRRMMAVFDPRLGYQQFSVDEDPDYYLLAKMTASTGTAQINVQPKGVNGERAALVDLAMKASDPHWYSVSRPAVTVPAGAVTNAGAAPTPVQITLTATAASAAGVNKGVIIGGDEVGYNGALNAGDQVVIDTDAWTLLLNGTNAIQGWYGEMPQLPGGASVVQTVGPVTAELTFSPRWMA